jgi:hypothetical protein
MDTLQMALIICIIVFLIVMLYTMIQIGILSSKSDSKSDMANAITQVTIVNSILMLVMAGLAFFYLNANEGSFQPYMIIMMHLSLLISVVSVSISSLQQIQSS